MNAPGAPAAPDGALWLGIDCGTSGVRAVAVDATRTAVGEAAAAMADFGDAPRAPATWAAAMTAALARLAETADLGRVRALSVDGTSGSMAPIDAAGAPLADGLMYDHAIADPAILDPIAAAAPRASAVHGATSGLARFVALQTTPGVARIAHQAGWLAAQFSGRFDLSDSSNALKTGFDPVTGRWPDWMAAAGARIELLPEALPPGAPAGRVTAAAARRFGLPAGAQVVAGMSDGCASFLATGAAQPGDGVTALGSTMTVKLLCDAPIFAPQFGIYSHRIGDRWLAGGASNTGGAVLARFFSADRIAELSRRIDPEAATGLDYYPLNRPGERFPHSDPDFAPRLTPRPADDAAFLHGLLEGVANVERLAYQRLAELGAPPLRSIRTVGGGARNPVWTAMREGKLGVKAAKTLSGDAAYGMALLALDHAGPA